MAADQELEQARDPATPPGELAWLARSARAVVRGAVASNPNCPIESLRLLGVELPARVVANPALDLFLLQEPRFFSAFTRSTRAVMAGSGGLTASSAAALAETDDRAVGLALARNRATPPAVLARLCVCSWDLVRSAASRHPRAPRRVLALLHAAGASPGLLTIQRRPRSAARHLPRAAALGGWGTLLAASSPWSPPGLLERLSGSRDPEVIAAIAANPAARPETLWSLARPQGRLTEDPRLSAKLAGNPASPPALLEALSFSIYSAVQGAIARHPSASPLALWRLAGSPEFGARAMARSHPHWPAALGAALDALGFPASLFDYPAEHRPAGEAELAPLADAGPWLWWYLLLHPATPDALFERLGARSWGTLNGRLYRAAGDAQTDPLLLRRLGLFSSPGVRDSLRLNPTLRASYFRGPG